MNRFEYYQQLEGKIFRQVKNRITKRVITDGKSVVVKLHKKMGLAEYIKTILKLKKPVTGARQEKYGIEILEEIGVKVPQILEFYESGKGFNQESFIALEDLGDCESLEDLVYKAIDNNQKLDKSKNKYIDEVAKIARKIHSNNIIHRDFYLCHFLKKDNELVLIDLHRCQKIKPNQKDLIIKDLGALLFSAENTLTKTDKLRFVKAYKQQSLREIFNNEKDFWQKVNNRAKVLFARDKRD